MLRLTNFLDGTFVRWHLVWGMGGRVVVNVWWNSNLHYDVFVLGQLVWYMNNLDEFDMESLHAICLLMDIS